MDRLRTVLCDDERLALEFVQTLFRETGRVEIVAASHSVTDAIAVINAGCVDLAVFDVEMPGLSGVDAFRALVVEPRPLLIFATAHPEYAIDAFELEAIDYLLKPLDQERVSRAVEKAERMAGVIRASETGGEEGREAGEQAITSGSNMLTVKDAGRTYFLPYDSVTWIEAAGDYSLLHTDDREHAIRIPIRVLAEQLPPDRFRRVHRSSIIAISHLRQIERRAKGEANLTLSTGVVVKASRTYRDAIQSLLAGIGEIKSG